MYMYISTLKRLIYLNHLLFSRGEPVTPFLLKSKHQHMKFNTTASTYYIWKLFITTTPTYYIWKCGYQSLEPH